MVSNILQLTRAILGQEDEHVHFIAPENRRPC